MTGGVVVILGKTGRNFGAGMSGGSAFVFDPQKNFHKQCNLETFELENVTTAADISTLKKLISNHIEYTGSTVAEKILANWEQCLGQFVKVMPSDYKRVLAQRAAATAA